MVTRDGYYIWSGNKKMRKEEWIKHPMTINLAKMLGLTPEEVYKLTPKQLEKIADKITPEQTWAARRY